MIVNFKSTLLMVLVTICSHFISYNNQTLTLTEVGDKINSIQLAIGTSYGTAIAANIIQYLYNLGYCIIGFDFHNAFNSIDQDLIHKGLERLRPQLIPFFLWKYSQLSDI